MQGDCLYTEPTAFVGGCYDGEIVNIRSRFHSMSRIAALSGSFFDPALVKAFLETSASEAFWLTLESHHLERQINETALHFADTRELTSPELMQLAKIFARIVDDKSRFTAEHSIGVSRLSRLLGQLSGLSAKDCELLEIAGLLHDIGKLRVPDEVLDKPRPLNEAEFAVIERHTFETWQILRRVRAFNQVAEWASFHHESICGNGYPFHRHDGEISIQARIVAVADIFQNGTRSPLSSDSRAGRCSYRACTNDCHRAP